MLTLTPRLILHNGHEIAPISQVTRGTTTSFLAFNAIFKIKDLRLIAYLLLTKMLSGYSLKGPFINLTSFVHMLNFVFIRGVVSFILVKDV